MNPFKCESLTEKLMVVREREREINRLANLKKKLAYTETSHHNRTISHQTPS